jgi:hypothetical protein
MVVSFIGSGNQNTWRKPTTRLKLVPDFITWNHFDYTSPWPGIEVTTWVVICTDLPHDLESKSQLEWWYVLIYHMTWNRSHNFNGDMYWFTTWPGIEVTTWVVICTDLPHNLESKSQLQWWYVLIYHMTWNRSHNLSGDMYWFTT